MIGLGLGIGISRSSGFNIASIFANGEQGVWLEPWETSTMFQDSAGTIPVTAVGQAVGLRLDKSKGLVLGPELITNGGFDTDTNWAKNAGVTVSGGELVFTSVASGNGASQDSSGIVAGRLYKVKLNVTSITAGGFRVKVGSGAYLTVSAGTGLKEFYCIAGAATTKVISIDASGTTSGTIDDVSVKELYGNHAYQTTATKRPIYSGFVDFDGIDDAQNIEFPDLGSDVTIARAVPGVGVSILTGQTIGAGTWAFNTDDNGLIIVNRALTPAETAGVTAYLNARI